MPRQVRPSEENEVLQAWGLMIRRYRRWKGLSRRDFARKAGISAVYLGEIERGQKDPSSHSLCRIAAALDVPLAELYLRVAARLETDHESHGEEQSALPLAAREESNGYLEGVSPAKDETAYDLYKAARMLRTDQQLSLLMLARSLR